MATNEFRALRELASFVRNNRMRHIDLIEPTGGSLRTKADELFEGLIENRFESDEDAASALQYGDPANPVYKNLRTQLQKRLLNSVFFIDLQDSSYTDRQRAYYEVQREWAAANILLGKNARLSGIRQFQKILKKARQFEFTEIVLDLTRVLRLHFATREGDLRRFEQYDQLYREYARIWEDENLAEGRYADLVVRYVNNKAIKETSHQKALEYYGELKDLLLRSPTYRTQLCIYLIRLFIHTSQSDYERTIEVCDEAVQLFESKPYQANIPLQVFYYQLLVSHTQLKQYERGKAAAQKCLELLDEGSFNWFKYQELFFILSMHTREYQAAYQVYHNTVLHRKFSYLPAAIVETWKIFEAYLHYLIDIGRIVPDPDDNRFSKFRLGRFLNDTPIFARDKRGMNIPILIIQILIMIQQQKFDEAVDRIEAIEKYCSRYLLKDDTYRSNCFIRMLLQIPASGFHRAAVVRKAARFFKKLQEVPLDVANQTHEVEILPYEDLWEMVLQTLDYSFH